jgi:uncharacterized membrane protein YeaQ/YmgE (transglycosylase-associated protein family)
VDANSIFVAFFVGLVGFAVFVYGKRQGRLPHLVAGVLLMAYPYFIDNAAISGAIGAVILLALWGAVRLGA